MNLLFFELQFASVAIGCPDGGHKHPTLDSNDFFWICGFVFCDELQRLLGHSCAGKHLAGDDPVAGFVG